MRRVLCLLGLGLLLLVLFDPVSYLRAGLPSTLKPLSANEAHASGLTAIRLKFYDSANVVIADTGWVNIFDNGRPVFFSLKYGSYRWSIESRNLLGIIVWSKFGVTDVVKDDVEHQVFRL